VALLEADVLPRRVPGYQPAELYQLCASGEVVWVGAGLERVGIYFRQDARLLGSPLTSPRPEGGPPEQIRAALAAGALFWEELLAAAGLDREEALPALWDLVWAGEVTNDSWQPLRAERRFETQPSERRVRRFARSRAQAPTATQGRWSLTRALFGPVAVPGTGTGLAAPGVAEVAPQELPNEAVVGASGQVRVPGTDRRALAELLLERQGIVTQGGVRAEGIPGGYGAVYGELKALEVLGLCRRGYFVEGLGGAQFALSGAVERLRELRPRPGVEVEALVLAAADPAQPYGAALSWPGRSAGRAARVAGAHVVLLGGEAVLFVERGGRSLLPLRDPDESWLRAALEALVAHVRRREIKRLAVERFDGEPVVTSDVMPLLLEVGFVAGPRRAVLRG